MTHSIARKT